MVKFSQKMKNKLSRTLRKINNEIVIDIKKEFNIDFNDIVEFLEFKDEKEKSKFLESIN